MHGSIIVPRPAAKLGTLVVAKRLLKLFPCIHHKRPVGHHRLIYGVTVAQQERGIGHGFERQPPTRPVEYGSQERLQHRIAAPHLTGHDDRNADRARQPRLVTSARQMSGPERHRTVVRRDVGRQRHSKFVEIGVGR